MLHPALSRALAIAHIEDLHRAADPRRLIRLGRRDADAPHVAAPPIPIARSASTRRPPMAGLHPRERQARVRRT
jgi:hypothetical protein